MNLKELIAASRTSKPVNVGSAVVYVKPISADIALKHLDWLNSVPESDKGSSKTSLEYMCRTVASTLVDDKGKAVCAEADWERLKELGEDTLTRLFDVAKGAEGDVKKD